MNKERLNEIALWLEAGAPAVPEFEIAGFSMPSWFLRGGKCCIVGYALARWDAAGEQLPYSETMTSILDVDLNTVTRLAGIDPDVDAEIAMRATPKEAARVVRHLIETGIVDWSVA